MKKSEFEKTRDRNIKKVKKSIDSLRNLGYSIEIKPTETLFGVVVDHIYIVDKGKNGYIFEQKHLFTV